MADDLDQAIRHDRAYANGMRLALVMAAQGAEVAARQIADRLNADALAARAAISSG